MKQLNYIIKPITKTDQQFLSEMLYYAIFIPEGSPSPPRSIINTPELSRYVKDWGKSNDLGFISFNEDNNQPIGAAWIRLMTKHYPGYGYVDDQTPELSIAVLPEFHNKGIGTQLLAYLLKEADCKYLRISLSVTVDNPAIRLYERNGFEVFRYLGTSLIMIKNRKN